jgi:hypothetical protein
MHLTVLKSPALKTAPRGERVEKVYVSEEVVERIGILQPRCGSISCGLDLYMALFRAGCGHEPLQPRHRWMLRTAGMYSIFSKSALY